jgi:hypothetical protein
MPTTSGAPLRASDAGPTIVRALTRRCVRARLAGAVLATFAGLSLGACGESSDSYVVGTGRWNDFDVTVESRPAPPRQGNNEVVIIVTGERRQPVFDAIVNLRAQPSAPWVQAIEDGHVGVYRRAVNFGQGNGATIEVQLRRGTDETLLSFAVPIRAAQ